MNKIRRVFALFKTIFYYKLIFKSIGNLSVIKSLLLIQGSKNIVIGNNVYIAYKSWLAAVPITANSPAKLIIGDGCVIGNFNHIYATESIELGKNVLTADKVYISDNLHSYENIHIPILKQQVKQISKVFIDDGAWIGENVCIIGANIGKNCVIGANSTVTKSIPDYCVAVGSPAYVIKRYCFETNQWKKTNKNGQFLDIN
jgi:acetyltransferase-like isoleucine patch superfamily enzyme